MALRYAYEQTPDMTSPLRRLLVTYAAFDFNAEGLTKIVKGMGKATDFLYDVTMVLKAADEEGDQVKYWTAFFYAKLNLDR